MQRFVGQRVGFAVLLAVDVLDAEGIEGLRHFLSALEERAQILALHFVLPAHLLYQEFGIAFDAQRANAVRLCVVHRGNQPVVFGDVVGHAADVFLQLGDDYYGLIAAMDYAQSHSIRALRIESDSELLVKQMRGQYKVKSEDLRPLFERAQKMSKTFDSFRIEHVYREQNREADALANEALDETENKAAGAATAKKTAATTAKTEPLSSKPEPASSKPEPRKIQARFRGGVLYLLEDVELPDGMVVDVSIHLRPKPPA